MKKNLLGSSVKAKLMDLRYVSFPKKIFSLSLALILVSGCVLIGRNMVLTRSAFQHTAPLKASVTDASFGMELTSIIDTTKPAAQGLDVTTITGLLNLAKSDPDPDAITTTTAKEGDSLGKTAEINGTDEIVTPFAITEAKPGDRFAFGYKASNVGNIQSILNMTLKTKYESNGISEDAKYGKDPRASYTYDIYEGDALNGSYTKITANPVGSELLSAYNTDTAITFSPNTRELAPKGKANDQKYYIIVLTFKDGSTPVDNFSGDNQYQQSGVDVTLTFKLNQK